MSLTNFAATSPERRLQFGALCYRIVKDKPQILLITSRGTRRWIVPKGWPMTGRTPAEAALREAFEEAGVVGRVIEKPVGTYDYDKLLPDGSALPCTVVLFPVRVSRLKSDFPEEGQRRRDWLSRKKAASRVIEPPLAQMIRDFDPKHFKP
ncbi:NUDIX hydrolase [Oceanicola sp. 22II-s10i]|nr:NUDIX hydrolase [Oceanicola sp. 22II-s10i]